jgi:hypothetical protein
LNRLFASFRDDVRSANCAAVFVVSLAQQRGECRAASPDWLSEEWLEQVARWSSVINSLTIGKYFVIEIPKVNMVARETLFEVIR